ncbi:DNA/RNA non-specific endonuclease [Lacticaseibacillus paracasei]|uniref:DNA/RNA non-specific endonuclease n=1 Tax=Lacticaseibacillus paracasei TaxID=1597 RepID=UPI0018A5B70E|nr:DNA/RNA non-specific endonuclease [Lacticaseibacillus paracasei]QOP49387.1 endonuclease [Lacticaseibacillus paracasei]
MNLKTNLVFVLSTVLAISVTGCVSTQESTTNQSSSTSSAISTSMSTSTTDAAQTNSDLANLPFDLTKYPQNYTTINHNVPVFENGFKQTVAAAQKAKTTRAQTYYDRLDDLGRTQSVSAIVTYGMMHSHSSAVRKRPIFPKTTKVAGEYADGVYNKNLQQWFGRCPNNQMMQLNGYRGYLYNKSHLLAWSLGGDMQAHNVILGTRAQNVGTNNQRDPGGMAYTETLTRNYLNSHRDDAVAYQAIPVYVGNELVPRGTHVLVQSIDHPDRFHYNVWVFNVQAGVTINYNNGSFQQKGD